VIVPIQQYLATVWRGGSPSIAAFTTDYWGMRGEIGGCGGAFTFGHLWFIFSLFLYSLAAAPHRPGRRTGRRTSSTRSRCSSGDPC
jgi:hypothetical protein